VRDGEGVIHLSRLAERRRLQSSPVLDSFLSHLGIWTISGRMPFVFSVKEAILLSLLLLLISSPASILVASFWLVESVCRAWEHRLWWYFSQLTVFWLLNVEHLIALFLPWLSVIPVHIVSM